MNDTNSGESDSLSAALDASADSVLPNGCAAAPENAEPADESETERVGVLDYMPSYKHHSLNVKCSNDTLKADLPLLPCSHGSNSRDKDSSEVALTCGRDIELKTFSITESCGDAFGESCASSFHDAQRSAALLSCASDDDELLVPAGADAEDTLQEIVVQSEQPTCVKALSNRAASMSYVDDGGSLGKGRTSASDREVTTFFRCIPAMTFGVTRDAAWSNPDTARTSPINSPDLVERTSTTASNNASFTVSSHPSGGESADGLEKQVQSSSRDQSPVVEPNKDPEIRLGANPLQPVEMMAMDRSQIDPNSRSNSNVVFFDNYTIWSNNRALYRDDSNTVGDRSEVEKRQERRDKRKKSHTQPVAFAKDIAGYVGEGKTIEELIEYITKTDQKENMLKGKTPHHGHPQTESKKTPGTAKSETSKTKSELKTTNESTTSSELTSSVAELANSNSVAEFEPMPPVNDAMEILVPSTGGVPKSVPKKSSVLQDAAGVTNTSEEAKRKLNKKAHRSLQHCEDSPPGEVFSKKWVDGLTPVCRTVPLEVDAEFGPIMLPATDLQDAKIEMIDSGPRLSDVEEITAVDNFLHNVDKCKEIVREELTVQSKFTDAKMCSGQTSGFSEMTQPGAKGTVESEKIQSVASGAATPAPVMQSNALGTNRRSSASGLVSPQLNGASYASPHLHERSPSVSSLPRDAPSSEFSYLDDGLLLGEEDGPWEEFQSKKKRTRNRAPQPVARSLTASVRRMSSGGAVPATPLKKTAADAISSATRSSNGTVHGSGYLFHSSKFQVPAGNIPKITHQGPLDCGVQGTGEVGQTDKSHEATDLSAGNPLQSSDSSHLGKNISVLDELPSIDLPTPKVENTTYARMAAKDSGCLSYGPHVGLHTGSLSYGEQQGENLFDAKTPVESMPGNRIEKLSKVDNLAAVLGQESELKIAEKQQLDRKPETADDKPSSGHSTSLSKVGLFSDGMVRPAVVFCGKAESQFDEENSGISFEYSDELMTGHSTVVLPSADIATSPIADTHLASGSFRQVSKSGEVTLSASGVNCGRPIAPLSGTGHASLTKTPVLIVSPLPKVLQEEQTVSHIADTDPETLKEVTVASAVTHRRILTEVKEPASRISVSSVLTGPSLSSNLTSQEKSVPADSSIIALPSCAVELDISARELTPSRRTSNQMEVEVLTKETHLEQSCYRRVRSLHASSGTLSFNVLEAAQYLSTDWERLVDKGCMIYYDPSRQ